MEIYDTIDADQIEIGDQVVIDGEAIEVSDLTDLDDEGIRVSGFSWDGGDKEEWILPYDYRVGLWAV